MCMAWMLLCGRVRERSSDDENLKKNVYERMNVLGVLNHIGERVSFIKNTIYYCACNELFFIITLSK